MGKAFARFITGRDDIAGVIGIGGGGGTGLPLPTTLARAATGGASLSVACGTGDPCVAGSGGGGAFRGNGEDGVGGQVADGFGALGYGSNLFLNPNDGNVVVGSAFNVENTRLFVESDAGRSI